MPYSQITYQGDGKEDTYVVPFAFIARSHVFVTLDGAPTTAYSWLTDQSIQFDAAPSEEIVIYRSTPRSTTLVNYQNASNVRTASLNTQKLQALYLIEELTDWVNTISEGVTPPSGALESYTHIQTVPAAVWSIEHNLNAPLGIVMVYTPGIEPGGVTYVDNDNVELDFDGELVSGTAIITVP